MASAGNVTVEIKAIDRASPVIRRVQRRLWWFQYGPLVAQVGVATLTIVAFIAGRITA